MLLQINKTSDERLHSRVTTAYLGLVYYVVKGRNAWHSTWINRYTDKSMYTSLSAAKKYCESQRVQGTVFNIFDLPSLVFSSNSGQLVISEINNQNYFNQLNLAKLKEIYDLLPIHTLSFQQIYLLFRAQSTLWPNNYPLENSILFTFTSSQEKLDAVPDSLIRRRSSSEGTHWPLFWRSFNLDKDDTDTLKSIVRRIRFNVSFRLRFE